MTKRFRTVVFMVLVVLFFVLGGAVVLYAQGWRADLDPLTLKKVGGIYVRTYPADAEVTLDGKLLERQNGLFDRGTLAANLFPQSYELKAQKAGYKPWSALLPVEPSIVTSHPAIVLIPENPRVLPGEGRTTDFRLFDTTILERNASGTITAANQRITGDTLMAGTSDGSRIITRNSKDGAYYLYERATATTTALLRAFPRFGAIPRATSTRMLPVPENPGLLLIAGSSTLRLANFTTGTATFLEEQGPVSAVAASPSRVAWTRSDAKHKTSLLSLYDLPSGSFMREADVIPGRTVEVRFSDRNNLLLLQEDGSLYSLAIDSGNRLKIGRNIRRFTISADGSSLAFIDKEGVNVISTRDRRTYSFFRLPEPASIHDLEWYGDDNHIFLGYPNRVVFLDLHDITLRNLTEVAPASIFEYAPESNELYYLENGTVKALKFPE